MLPNVAGFLPPAPGQKGLSLPQGGCSYQALVLLPLEQTFLSSSQEQITRLQKERIIHGKCHPHVSPRTGGNVSLLHCGRVPALVAGGAWGAASFLAGCLASHLSLFLLGGAQASRLAAPRGPRAAHTCHQDILVPTTLRSSARPLGRAL